MSAGSGSSSSAGVAKAKARTSSSIPQMRATGVLRDPAPNAVANPNAPRSDRLEEEARRMEERLRQLKVAMTTEKQKRDAITKTKAGTERCRDAMPAPTPVAFTRTSRCCWISGLNAVATAAWSL